MAENFNSVATLLEYVHQNASEDYTSRISEELAGDFPSVKATVLSDENAYNAFLDVLVKRIGMFKAKAQSYSNHFASLKSDNMPLGAYINITEANPAISAPFDGTGNINNLLGIKKPVVFGEFHEVNRQAKFYVTITREQVINAFVSEQAMTDFISMITNTLYTGDAIEEEMLTKGMFGNLVSQGKINSVEVELPVDAQTARNFVKTAKSISSMMAYPSSTFNASPEKEDGTKFTTWTPKERQMLILRADLEAQIDVDVLAQAFNLDKTTLLPNIIWIDNFGVNAPNMMGLICDSGCPIIKDQIYTVRNFENPESLYTNYFVHHWQIISFSLLGNAVAFVEKDEDIVTP